ncbi:MAG: efflux RND transporter permease subunit [Candidatus Latescibacterota bacterium]|nr:MAG: efflux RND transporter permease subunit [Candidatus Latescibacterota bacterium]
MQRLYEMAVHKPVIVTICLVTLLVLGAISVYKLPIEFFPKMDFPFIGVFVTYPNSVPTHVERQIAKPIEEVMSTLGDVRWIFSESTSDGAFVGVVFDWGRNVDVLRMEVKEKVDQIRGELPQDIERIQLFTFNSDDQPIMVGRISAKGRDLMGSYDLLEKTIINPLQRIEGVGRVGIDGIEPQEVSIYLEMDKLKAHRVDVDALFRVIQTMNLTASLGEVTSQGLRYNVRGVGSFSEIEEIENLIINDRGLRLKDVATVYFGEPLIDYGRYLDGEPCIAFWIQKASDANSVELGRRVQKHLDKINADPRLEGINVLLFWNQSEQILNSLNGLRQAGIIGALFAIVVLYFFLRRVTTTLIIAIAIPFAILCTCGYLYFTGMSLNILTMMGLMLGVGMLVDNAIVVLESIFRHQSEGEERVHASIVGSKEVARAVIAATLTSIIVFAPVIFTSDSDGLMLFLAQVGITISVALIFSLLISLTLIPFLTSRMLAPKEVRSSAILNRIQERYVRMLKWTTVKRPILTGLVIIPVLVILSFVTVKVSNLKLNMMEGELIENLYIDYEFTDNLTYDQTKKYVEKIQGVIFAKKDSLGIRQVYSYYADNAAGTTLYFHDKYLSEKMLKETREKLRKMLPELAGLKLRFGDEQGGGGGGVQRIQVTLFGEDMDRLDEYAQEVKRRFSLIDGLEDIRTSIEAGSEEIQISLNRDVAQQYNLSPQTVSGIMNLTFRGMPLRRFQTADREVPMWLSLSPEDKVGIHNLENLLVGMTDDRELTLGTVADLNRGRGPTTIRRQHQKAAVSVDGTYYSDEVDDMMGTVAAVMNSIQLPLGYSWSFGDEIQRQQEQKLDMLINILLALVCVYLVMAALFESLLHPLIIMFCLPFSGVGVILALVITGTDFNLMVFIGMVILIGIVVNNGIVLIDHVNNFRRQGLTIYEAIFEGGRERFRPIVMTACTTILGLMPMAVGQTNIAGTQYYPLARAVIGGLAVGTFLTLIALPTYYVIGERFAAWIKRLWATAKLPRRTASTSSGT